MALCVRSLVVAVAVAVVVAVMLPELSSAALSSDANSPQAFLTAHNDARLKVGVPALKWSTSLASYALGYANSQKKQCRPLKHSRGPYGENLFWGSGAAWTPAKAVGRWVAEQRNYGYATNTCQAGQVCGHYTQVVWKATTHVGCASVECSDGAVFIICSYNPRGNYIGRRPY